MVSGHDTGALEVETVRPVMEGCTVWDHLLYILKKYFKSLSSSCLISHSTTKPLLIVYVFAETSCNLQENLWYLCTVESPPHIPVVYLIYLC